MDDWNRLDNWPENEVRKVSRPWKDDNGQLWLAVFDLANLRGRIECVGVALRSSLAEGDPLPKLGVGSLMWEAEREAANNSWWDASPGVPDAERAHDAKPALSLRPLRAVVLRQLPLAEVLREARRDKEDELRGVARDIRAYQLSGIEPEHFEEAAAAYSPDTGRAPRIEATHRLLERVAGVYQRAWRGGAEPPNAAVLRELQTHLGHRVTATQARKLVEKCRKTVPPLLPHLALAERRKARGWLMGDAGIPAQFDEWSTDPSGDEGSKT